MPSPRTPMGTPKIQGFVARDVHKIVFLYRRRAKETFVFLFTYGDNISRSRNQLKLGSRFTGRFYPSRCDLSPDAKHFVYFVMGGAQKQAKERYYCWTAMCRPPALAALFLLPHQDTWGGGGIFPDNHNLLIEAGMHDERDELNRLHETSVDNVKLNIKSGYLPLKDIGNGPPIQSYGWKRNDIIFRVMTSGTWKKKSKHATLLASDALWEAKRGDFNMSDFGLVDKLGRKLLPDEIMRKVTWADIDLCGRLLLAIGHEIHIYNNPKKGMSLKANRVLDLEAASAET